MNTTTILRKEAKSLRNKANKLDRVIIMLGSGKGRKPTAGRKPGRPPKQEKE